MFGWDKDDESSRRFTVLVYNFHYTDIDLAISELRRYEKKLDKFCEKRDYLYDANVFIGDGEYLVEIEVIKYEEGDKDSSDN